MAKTTMPEWLEPMAATLTQDRFTGDDWLFERKFDGIRLLAYKHGTSVKLYSRNRLLQNIPGVERAIAAMPVKEPILDGEVTWDRQSGYHVFDILWLDGRSTTSLPLEERRCAARHADIQGTAAAASICSTTTEPWERARREGWEGVIAKRRGSPYEHRRSKHWLKMKMRSVAGAGRRRLHRSARRASRARRAARRLLRRR